MADLGRLLRIRRLAETGRGASTMAERFAAETLQRGMDPTPPPPDPAQIEAAARAGGVDPAEALAAMQRAQRGGGAPGPAPAAPTLEPTPPFVPAAEPAQTIFGMPVTAGLMTPDAYQKALAELSGARAEDPDPAAVRNRVAFGFATALAESQPEGSVFEALGQAVRGGILGMEEARARAKSEGDKAFVATTVDMFNQSRDPRALAPLLMLGKDELYLNLIQEGRVLIESELREKDRQLQRAFQEEQQAFRERDSDRQFELQQRALELQERLGVLANELGQYNAVSGRINATKNVPPQTMIGKDGTVTVDPQAVPATGEELQIKYGIKKPPAPGGK